MASQTNTAGSSQMAQNQIAPSRSLPFAGNSLFPVTQDSSSREVQQYHELANEIQKVKSEHQDIVMQLQIRIAVLESLLEHARKEKENALSSLPIIIHALTQSPPAATITAVPTSQSPVPQAPAASREVLIQKDAEIERLRKENRHLRSKTKELPHDDSVQGRSRQRNIPSEPFESSLSVPLYQSGWSLSNDGDKGKGKEKAVDPVPAKISYAGLQDVPTGPRAHMVQVSSESSDPSGSLGQSFGSNLSTIPNTPMVAGTNLSFLSGYPACFDVGLHSLEDELNDDGPPNYSTVSLDEHFPDAIVSNSYPPLEKGIDEQLADEDVAMLKFKGPAPGVIKTGFSVEGNKRRDDYENRPPPPRTYSRDPCLWQNHNSASGSNHPGRFGQRNSSHIPRDGPLDTNLWDSFEEREDAIRANMHFANRGGRRQGDIPLPDVFKHGVLYLPEVTGGENYERTVHVWNLPKGTELREVLARVRGGDIMQAALLPGIKLSGGVMSMSARVVFKESGAAKDYVLYAEKHPIEFGESKQKASITLVTTPAYPLSPSQTFKARVQSRCIAIPDIPEDFSLQKLDRILDSSRYAYYRTESLVECWVDNSKTLHLEFSNIESAGSAFGILSARRIQGLQTPQPRFEADPCAGPVEELAQDNPPSRPTLPDFVDESTEDSNESSEIDEHDERAKDILRHLENMQRKRPSLSVLSNQKVTIPTMNGANIKSSLVWADDDDDEEPLPGLSASIYATPNVNLQDLLATPESEKSSKECMNPDEIALDEDDQ
ncbi:uncharacterized protein PAC_00887 [Phialocephala subalpina]|uniref:Uncharacterized protein n=1 Tax=Phialocephala subalpina TaxID=576137 RepID=A0A1L7WDZ6_9HELO|nr:uncharacterized protein PAC_00887 [Phialocephala subalpina]